MKKYTLIFSIVLGITFLFSACSKQESVVSLSPLAASASSIGVGNETNTGVKSAEIEADTLYNPQTVEELEKLSPNIFEGILSDDGGQTVDTMDLEGQEVPFYGRTVSSLKVTKVYKGNLKKGDSIKFAECYYTLNTGKGKTIYHLGNYMPSKPDKKYLFFLSEKKDNNDIHDVYNTTVLEKSRYPVPSKTFDRMSIQTQTNEELSLGPKDPEDYKALYEKVLDKYYP